MKALNVNEIDFLLKELSVLRGLTLQGLIGREKFFAFKFWNKKLLYLLVNLEGTSPYCILAEKPEDLKKITDFFPQKKSQSKAAFTKPVFMFLKRHFIGEAFIKAERTEDYGRVVNLYFSESKKMELRLFPGGGNFGLFSEEKKVYLLKPHKLEKTEPFKAPKVRSPQIIKEQIFLGLEKNKKQSKAKEKDKTGKALIKIEEALGLLKKELHRRLAEKLQKGEALSADLEKLYKNDLSLQKNIDRAFLEHKKNASKIERLQKRKEELLASPLRENLPKEKKKVGNAKKARIFWPESNLRALCGRSSKENIELLRKAKPWHLWMHLKDYPSGHLILEKPKGADIKEEQLKKCADFLFQIAAPKKLLKEEGLPYEIIFTDCRYVRPIKGERLGLVCYSKEESRLYKWSPPF